MDATLTKEFQKFVGLIIKHPHRVTCDMDAEAEKICDEARQHNLQVNFIEAGFPAGISAGTCVQAVNVEYTKTGVPADKQAWGYRVSKITVK